MIAKMLQTGIAAMAIVAIAAPAAAKVVCLDRQVVGESVFGPIPYTTKSAARHSARGNWERRVQDNAHATFADWGMARKKKVSCNRVPNGFGGYNHTCVYRGDPCRNE